eukprot:scaffold15077_cov49-Phaeocystis_antarctica.AAC.1
MPAGGRCHACAEGDTGAAGAAAVGAAYIPRAQRPTGGSRGADTPPPIELRGRHGALATEPRRRRAGAPGHPRRADAPHQPRRHGRRVTL